MPDDAILLSDGTSMTLPSALEICTTRRFEASRERVFEAFFGAEMIPRWWGIGDTATIVEAIDLRPGGVWRYIEWPKGGAPTAVGGVYHEVEIPKRVVFTFAREAVPDNEVVNTVVFDEQPDGDTSVTITSRFATSVKRDAMRALMQQGFNEEYRALDRVLAQDAAQPLTRDVNDA
jgi:uncharacterized protein YndB with AHSA1/START domain